MHFYLFFFFSLLSLSLSALAFCSAYFLPNVSFHRDRRRPHRTSCPFQWCSGSHWASSKSQSIIKCATSLAVQHEIVGKFRAFRDSELLASCSLQQERERERNPTCHLCLSRSKMHRGGKQKAQRSEASVGHVFCTAERVCTLCPFQVKMLFPARGVNGTKNPFTHKVHQWEMQRGLLASF